MGRHHDKDAARAAFHVMRAELTNCPVNYEDPGEEEEMVVKLHPISAPKTVTWKSVVTTTFKTPQQSVGQNRGCLNKPKIDRQLRRTKFPREKHTRTIGVPRLGRTAWPARVPRGTLAKQ